MTADRAAVVFDRLSYFYPDAERPALREISLTVRRGEFLGLIGPTGAGKTTLCLTLNGIVPQFYGGRFFGSVRVLGLDTVEHPTRRLARHVGAVFQDPETQLIATSVEDEIAFALENLSVPREEIARRIPWVLEAVRLEGSARKHPHELSGGQKQRLAIGAALAMRPDLLVLDEPTSQLDPLGQQEVFAVLRTLNETLGVTVVVVSHAAEMIAEHADRVGLLSGGVLEALGTPDEIYTRHELLQAHDLRPPQVTGTFARAARRGVPVEEVPVRLDAGRKRLETLIAHIPEFDPPAPRPAPSGNPRDPQETPAPLGGPVLSASHLSYRYPDGTGALTDLSLEIRPGEYVLLVGQNGAGKTTLVKQWTRLLLPTAGRAEVFGSDTRTLDVSRVARRVGYVAQNPDHQLFRTTVASEVAYALERRGLDREEIDARVSASLAAMGLAPARDAHPLSLPRGDRGRVVLAAVLAMEPEVLILDEPTTGQDHRAAKEILEVTRRLHGRGRTILVVTHHLYLMAEYAERVIVMGEGTVLLDAPIREAYHRTDLLRSTYLEPPQAVLLAQHWAERMGRPLPLLTPAEVADALAAGWHAGVDR